MSLTNSAVSMENKAKKEGASLEYVAPEYTEINERRSIYSEFMLTPWAGVLIGLVVISACLSMASPYFLSFDNIVGTIALYLSWICIAGFGQSIVIIGGGLDLSVGSIMGFAGMMCAIAMDAGFSPVTAIGLAMILGCLIGLANGLAVSWIGLNPFIATLASLSMVRGLTFGIAQGEAFGIPDDAGGASFSALGNGTIQGVPIPVIIMLVLGLVLLVVMNNTRYGRRVYALGGNENAAKLLGINVFAVKTSLYVISGLFAAIGGILLLARAGTAMPDAGVGYELNVIAAVIIGGTSLAGGRGSIPGVLIGAALLGVITNGIVLMGLAGYWQQFIIGAVIATAASLDVLRNRFRARRGL